MHAWSAVQLGPTVYRVLTELRLRGKAGRVVRGIKPDWLSFCIWSLEALPFYRQL